MTEAHSTLGASSAHRWMTCPGSVRLYELVPEPKGEPSIHAEEGTRAHEFAAQILNGEVSLSDGNGIVFTKEPGAVSPSVDPEMIQHVQTYVDYVNSLEGETRLVEERVDLSRLKPTPPIPMFGTADAIVWNPKRRRLHVVDFKYGKGVKVEVKDNPQLLYYALGAVLALRVRPETIQVTVVQPRADHRDGPIREHVYDWQELTEFKNKLLEAAQIAAKPDAPVGPVGSHCRWCRAKAVCPAQQEHAVEVAQSEFEVFDAPAPEILSPERLAYIADRAPFIEQWLTEIRNYLKAQMEEGREIPGWKLVPKRAVRKWEDENVAGAFLMAGAGLDERKIYETKLISPAKAEKLLTEEHKDMLQRYITKHSSGATLAPETDARRAIEITDAADEFTAN